MDAPSGIDRIRNFSIIAHIDHGKSTLSDRILEVTGAVQARDMRAQYLDSMDLERERGITIKAQNVRVEWKGHVFHLIDTPGHVDFGYEVSRSLAACEGVVLVVDAAQGIEAQTLANCYLALENDLEIVACLNKIDLPAADPDRYAMEIETVLGIPAEDILRISAKTGEGVPELLDAIAERIPAPVGDPDAALQALIFDSQFDQYRGVVSSVRVMSGRLTSGSKLQFMQAGATHEALEIGVRRPATTPVSELGPGEVGYLIAGIKDVGDARSGETVTTASRGATEPLSGYRDPKPMVFSGLFPIDGDDFEDLRESLAKLKLNDASITYTPESSGALGFGFRCGFLGLLHMEIVKERLEREFGLALIATAPSVEYRVTRTDGEVAVVDNPSDLPPPQQVAFIEEPVFKVSIITPTTYTGALMELCQSRRGEMQRMDYLSPERVELVYEVPLAEVVVDFFDQLKSRSQGYASLDYELAGYQRSNLVRVDLLLNGQPADAFSTIVHRDNAESYGRRMCEKLRELIPRQMFDVPIQAAIGGKVIARETVKAKRKDVLAKCYGGDITRKRKLLEKQKEGKKKMKAIGRVEVPGDVFISALKLDD
ncbi:MAG: GTP-binding protein LepA [Actinomycetota bacterium]|jgi:GTP-binding protein LepA